MLLVKPIYFYVAIAIYSCFISIYHRNTYNFICTSRQSYTMKIRFFSFKYPYMTVKFSTTKIVKHYYFNDKTQLLLPPVDFTFENILMRNARSKVYAGGTVK